MVTASVAEVVVPRVKVFQEGVLRSPHGHHAVLSVTSKALLEVWVFWLSPLTPKDPFPLVVTFDEGPCDPSLGKLRQF